ncbi:MAG: prepilin-type N-terminal cleavage/methylation domain-containing protein [Candidatus Omnitrophica bacterium]|nr:prepilin-type N-terminal cleavage/methylation domain-containing protein [Candidatus Omnitrophota bacterium]
MSEKKDFGFTLVEMMVTVFIFLLLIGALFTVLATGSTSWQIGDVRIELQQELRKGMDWIGGELRQGGTFTIEDVPADGSWYDKITFRKPQDVIDGNVVWENEEIQYLLGGSNDRQLLRKVDDEERILANNIISFQVRRQPTSPEIVEITLQADKRTVKGHIIELDLNFQIKLRN